MLDANLVLGWCHCGNSKILNSKISKNVADAWLLFAKDADDIANVSFLSWLLRETARRDPEILSEAGVQISWYWYYSMFKSLRHPLHPIPFQDSGFESWLYSKLKQWACGGYKATRFQWSHMIPHICKHQDVWKPSIPKGSIAHSNVCPRFEQRMVSASMRWWSTNRISENCNLKNIRTTSPMNNCNVQHLLDVFNYLTDAIAITKTQDHRPQRSSKIKSSSPSNLGRWAIARWGQDLLNQLISSSSQYQLITWGASTAFHNHWVAFVPSAASPSHPCPTVAAWKL